MNTRLLLPSFVLLSLGMSCGSQDRPENTTTLENSTIPKEYQDLAIQLEAILDSFDADLASRLKEPSGAVSIMADLLPANSHRGEELLHPTTLSGVELYLDGLKSLGVSGVKVGMAYPLLTPEFPRSNDYWRFFRRVAQAIRERGMKLLVGGTGPLFPSFTKLPIDYTNLTFKEYIEARRGIAHRIVQDIAPDYLTIANEPTSDYRLTRLKELLDPQKFGELVAGILQGIGRGNTKLGAGMGSWDNPKYTRVLSSIQELDYIDLHIYPITSGFLNRASEMAEIARTEGKDLVIGEAYLYKATESESSGAHAAATWNKIFARDAFSFWEGLDKKFMRTMVRFAKCHGVSSISFYWSKYFFAYLDYNEKFKEMTPEAILREADRAAVNNLLAGKASNLGNLIKTLGD